MKPYVHVVSEARLLGSSSPRRGLAVRIGKRLCEVSGKRAFREYILRHHDSHRADWDRGKTLSFKLRGSTNKRQFMLIDVSKANFGRRVRGAPIIGGHIDCGRVGPLCYSHSTFCVKRHQRARCMSGR